MFNIYHIIYYLSTGGILKKLMEESTIQCSYLTWLELQYPAIFKVTASFPNGGARTKRYGARLKREGMKKGFPDIGIFWPSGIHHGMFIEFKSENGKLNLEQKKVLAELQTRGYNCVICKSLESAIKETKIYLI
jgi:hypothetical protein